MCDGHCGIASIRRLNVQSGSVHCGGVCYCNSTVNNRVKNRSPAFRVDLVRKGSTKLENCNLVSVDLHFLLLAINFLVCSKFGLFCARCLERDCSVGRCENCISCITESDIRLR